MYFYFENYLKKLRRLPFFLLFFISIICSYGFFILYAAAGGVMATWAHKQIIVFSIFMPVAILISVIDLRLIFNFAYLFYLIVILLLIAVELVGKTTMGATRWLNLGLFHIQPSEPAKIAIVLFLARYFHHHPYYNQASFLNKIMPITGILIPIALTIKQPDLGTGIIMFFVAVIMFFVIGIRITYFLFLGLIGILTLPVAWYFMHNYQRNRLLIFIDPESEPLGAGYNIIQSKIAIGSGGLFGKGILSGTQSHLHFLPEYQTDFIFSFLAEELGFTGGLVLLILYFIVMVNILAIVVNCQTIFAKLLVAGIGAIFFCHIFINISMVMGIVPVVGVPLPLISSGGTMMASMLTGFGLIMNARVNLRSKI